MFTLTLALLSAAVNARAGLFNTDEEIAAMRANTQKLLTEVQKEVPNYKIIETCQASGACVELSCSNNPDTWTQMLKNYDTFNIKYQPYHALKARNYKLFLFLAAHPKSADMNFTDAYNAVFGPERKNLFREMTWCKDIDTEPMTMLKAISTSKIYKGKYSRHTKGFQDALIGEVISAAYYKNNKLDPSVFNGYFADLNLFKQDLPVEFKNAVEERITYIFKTLEKNDRGISEAYLGAMLKKFPYISVADNDQKMLNMAGTLKLIEIVAKQTNGLYRTADMFEKHINSLTLNEAQSPAAKRILAELKKH